MHVQTMIHAGYVMPMTENRVVLTNHAILINEGRITAIIDPAQCTDVTANVVYDLPDHIVLPGFVNAHTHAPMNLLRGLGADLPLMQWLQTKIWPAEGKLMSPAFCHDGALLAGEEMLASGVTCANDHYFFSADVARGLTKAGMKCSVSAIIIGFPSAMAADDAAYLRCAQELFEEFADNRCVRVTVGPHAPYTVSDTMLLAARDLSEKYNARIHMHVDETQTEIEDSLKQYGMRPIERLHKLGLLNNRFISVHTVHPDDKEIELLAQSGASIVHCPCSNLKLASGFSPVSRMMQAGINLAIGTDGVASNDKLDMLGETRLAAMLGKTVANDTTAMKVTDLLYAATMGGAKALGWDDRIGSIEAGKDADLIAVDLEATDCIPVSDAASQLLYSAGREDITHVWVDGKLVVKKQQSVELRSLSREKLQNLAKTWQNRI